MKFVIAKFSPPSCRLIPVRSICSQISSTCSTLRARDLQWYYVRVSRISVFKCFHNFLWKMLIFLRTCSAILCPASSVSHLTAGGCQLSESGFRSQCEGRIQKSDFNPLRNSVNRVPSASKFDTCTFWSHL